ncbi:efflux RND transporter permease subunit [Ruegeria sp.]|uniref:efflux RND transporter permease subunit n=1 Tax=Ruegeria sp. TaxID=1879320 RepID=UPI002319E2CE|nr:efflux RND transporter permease subunit [Ruegeria sp.]MDA7965599.1 efflux RND transporter permease subunit [Ruegeria sp.]
MTDTKQDLASISVRRPLLAMVLNLLIAIAGLAALTGLDVRELPNVDRPVVMVRADFPGAAPTTVDAELTGPLEDAVARVSGVRSIEAASEEANMRIRVEFEPGTDMDTAAADIREAISRVEGDLPSRMEKLTIVKSDSNAAPVVQVAVVPDYFDHMTVSERVENDIAPHFYSIPGVASVDLYGLRARQLHVALDPLQLSRFRLSVTEVADALRQAPYDIPVGSYASRDQTLLVRAEASAISADLIEEIVIRDGIRVGDVAQAYFAPAPAANFVRLNGEPAIGLGVVRQAGSNTVDISHAVRQAVDDLSRQYDDLTFTITSDQAVFIESATNEVLRTLALTTMIVVLSILLFFGRFRPTMIPSLAIPAALVGALAGFYLFGFSINLITLLALVLATGLTVDDAIVVLENIQRRQKLGEDRKTAAIKGTRQVFFAVLATTAVLIAVFIPISFLPSATGRLFREFGIVLAVAVAISSFVALTLVPALAARVDLSRKSDRASILERFGSALRNSYLFAIRRVLNHPVLVLLLCLGFAGGVAYKLPTLTSELTPPEDRGAFEVFAFGPDGIAIEYMQGQADAVEEALLPHLETGAVQSVYTVVGRWDPNMLAAEVTLAPWAERSLTQDDVIASVENPLGQIPGSDVSAFGRSSFETDFSGRSGISLALTGPTYPEIHQAALALSDAMEDGPFEDVEVSYNPTQPQLSLEIDRQSAADLGVSLDELAETLRVLVNGEDLVDLNVDDQAVPVVLTTPTGLIQDPADLRDIYITSASGSPVPLSSLTTLTQTGIAAELERTAQRRAIEVEAEIADIPISQAIAELRVIADATLPPGIDYLLMGEAGTFEETNRDLLLTYAFAIVIVFLVLIAQFENLTSPLVVMATIPFGLAATIAAMMATGVTLNIFSQIGLVLLIGLMAKNGILLVEFADQERRNGTALRPAIEAAAKTRLRPIAMTLLSTMIGSLPLILSGGAGAEARAAIGWTIFAGLGLSSLFTLFLTPALYLLIARDKRVSEAPLPQQA